MDVTNSSHIEQSTKKYCLEVAVLYLHIFFVGDIIRIFIIHCAQSDMSLLVFVHLFSRIGSAWSENLYDLHWRRVHNKMVKSFHQICPKVFLTLRNVQKGFRKFLLYKVLVCFGPSYRSRETFLHFKDYGDKKKMLHDIKLLV